MNFQYLIKENGIPFVSSELDSIRQNLDELNTDDRRKFRDENAKTIAESTKNKLLILSGPGTGKSYIFKDRIDYWLKNNSESSVLVTTFVRKLVTDLHNDIKSDETLSDEQKRQVEVYTLHKFARSVVERNNGTSDWPFKRHFRIIGQDWKEIIWSDVLAYYPEYDKGIFSWSDFEGQLHKNQFEEYEEWKKLRRKYFEMCEFYNAAGFADLIIRAMIALEENPTLNQDDFFIIDEYQDFNKVESELISKLVRNSRGILVVGDDDQVLYEELKCGKAELIRVLYENKEFANAILPFTTRNTCHIAKCAEYFIRQVRDEGSIEKIYLPIEVSGERQKVQVIACATSSTAVDYIEKFVIDHKDEIESRKCKLVEGEETDPFLLILTPKKDVGFYSNAKERLFQLVSEYKDECRGFSEDYYRVLNYYLLAKNPHNNFIFRKVLHYEGFSFEQVHSFIIEAMEKGVNLCDLDSEGIRSILSICNNVKDILDEDTLVDQKVNNLSQLISLVDNVAFKQELEQEAINQVTITKLERGEEEEAELEEIEIKKMCAVELMTIVGSKGLSADHVILIGFDNVYMQKITRNAFYVAMTRARQSLHLITALKSGGATRPANFLDQLPEDHIEFYSYRKSDRSKSSLKDKKEFLNYLNNLRTKSKPKKEVCHAF